jgi:Mlc titration factor MtfA (ptsG expression regulator)
MIWKRLKSWRRQRLLEYYALPDAAWSETLRALPLLHRLNAEEQQRLRELTTLFLHEKDVQGAAGYLLKPDVSLKIAAQACLPILNLGLEYYAGWVSIIVYPNEFIPEREYVDEAGVVHVVRDAMIGESWERGPVILSAADAERSGNIDGVNVVIHEFAHKLDMLNGPADGFPPLHAEMSRTAWSAAFGSAYEDFCGRVDAGEETAIDPYAAESPAEFFAVMSEAFFELPRVLQQEYPNVYRQLATFYRQDPAVG